MKKFSLAVMAMLAAVLASFGNILVGLVDGYTSRMGLRTNFVLLSKAAFGYPAGSVVSLPTSTEQTLIASGQAITAAGPVTPGAVTTTMTSGMVAVLAGQSSVVVNQASCTPSSRIGAVVSQFTADATALHVTRVVPAAGFFTIFVVAAATLPTQINWFMGSIGDNTLG